MEQMLRTIASQNAMLLSRVSALEKMVTGATQPFDPVSDPAPDGGGWGGWPGGWPGGWGGGWKLPVRIDWPFGVPGGWKPGGPVDPNPDELGKFSRIQIESRLADLSYARMKLDQMETMYREALAGM